MNESIIISALHKFFANHDYRLNNVFIYMWESDFFCISTSGYAIEVEVKISKGDFRADFKKTEKHFIIKNGNRNYITIPGRESNFINENGEKRWTEHKSSEITVIPSWRPNKFYYCCPENMIEINEVPEYAGLLYFIEEDTDSCSYHHIKQAKSAKFIHKEKLDLSKKLLSKYYYTCMDQARDIMILKDRLNEMSNFYHYRDDFDQKLKSKNIPDKPFFQQTLF